MRQEDIAFNGPLRFGKQQGKADHHVPIKWKLPDPQCSFCFRSKLICDTGGTTRCSACVKNNVACYVRIPKPVPRPQPTPRPTPQPPPRSGASLNANVVCDTGGSMHHSPRVGNNKDSYPQGGSARPTAFVPNKRRYKPQGAPRPTKGVPTSQKCAPCFADRSACDGKSPCNRCIERGIRKRGIPLRCKPQGAPRYHKGVPIDQRCGPCFRSKRACDGKSPCGKCIESKSRCKPPRRASESLYHGVPDGRSPCGSCIKYKRRCRPQGDPPVTEALTIRF
jgi:hypothetical protein